MKRYLFESKLGRCKRRVILRKVLLFMIVNLIFTACSSSSKENTFEIYGEEKQEIIGEYTERFLEPIERDNISGYSDTDRERFENMPTDRKSTRLNSSHVAISYAVFCLKKKKKQRKEQPENAKR